MTTTPIKPTSDRQSLLKSMTPEQKERAIAMLDEWANAEGEDAQEQCETGEYLKKALDEERMRIGARTLFS